MIVKTVAVLLISSLFSAHLYAAETLYIAVTSSFTQTLNHLADEFPTQNSEQIRISSASTGKLYTQIQQGANFDLFFAADNKHPFLLEKDDKIANNSRYSYAIGKLVLWSPNNNTSKNWQDLLNETPANKLAIANPHYAPYGIAAVEFLKTSNLWDQYNNNLIVAQNVNQAFLYIDSGLVNRGLITLSQLLYKYQTNSPAAEITYWEIPQKYYNPIVQQAVILKHAENKSLAKRFMQHIKSKKSQTMIQDSGYLLPDIPNPS